MKTRSSAVSRSLLVAATMAVAFVGASARAAGSECPNQAVRAEQGSGYLGDCRAYELVSPPTAIPYLSEAERDAEIVNSAQAAPSGEALSWRTFYPLAVSNHGGFFYRSRRAAGGWQTEEVTPGQSTWQAPEVNTFTCQDNVFFSSELEDGLLIDGEGSDGLAGEGVNGPGGEKEYCGNNEPELVVGEPRGVQNLFLMGPAPGAYSLINLTPTRVTPSNAYLQDATPNLSHVVFSENAALTPGALPGNDLYEWFNGAVHLVSVLPEGKAVAGALVDAVNPEGQELGAAPYVHGVSDDGSRVFFRAEGKLFVRLHTEAEPHEGLLTAPECLASAQACTIQIDVSQAQPQGPGGGGRFLAADAEGSRVFFIDESSAKLTSDTQEFSLENLYEYDVNTGTLRNLTPVSKAKVLGLSAIGEDGSHLYFAAEGVLAPGATLNKPNLYLAREGQVTFIATVQSAAPQGDWQPPEQFPQFNLTEASPDGMFFAFDSAARLTSYNNTDANTGNADEEVYLYNAQGPSLTCVSCDPTRAAPVGNAKFAPLESVIVGAGPARLRALVTDAGTVFFETPDALASGDENGVDDVYEYRQGEVRLVSSGRSPDPSHIEETSADGQDVFFITTQALTRGDTGNGLSIYDARVGGGFPEPPETPPCDGEGCRGAYSGGEALGAPISNAFRGPGNAVAPKEAVAKSRGRPALTRAQKRTKALKACRRRFRRSKRSREACEGRVRRLYSGKAGHHAPRRTSRKRGVR